MGTSGLRGIALAAVVAAVPASGPADSPSEYPLVFATHVPASQAPSLRDGDLVVGVVVNGQARAYPAHFLWAEGAHTVNDELGESPIAVSLCPLAGASAAFSRRLDGERLEVGTLTATDRGSLVLYDGDTHTRWRLLTGKGFSGPLAGRRLERLPSLFATWKRWRSLHPDTTVYVGPGESRDFQVDDQRLKRVLLAGGPYLQDHEWVIGVVGERSSAAFVGRSLVVRRVANTSFEERPIVLFMTEDLITTLVWDRSVAGRVLFFEADGDRMRDRETGSTWDAVSGRAVDGSLEGRTLSRVPAVAGFWRAWKGEHPETIPRIDYVD